VLDPMLATGGSASAAVTVLKERGCKHIKLMCLIASPEGIVRVFADHPDVDIYTAARDERLNENGYIIPGLGMRGIGCTAQNKSIVFMQFLIGDWDKQGRAKGERVNVIYNDIKKIYRLSNCIDYLRWQGGQTD